jgi:hypothetical protein
LDTRLEPMVRQPSTRWSGPVVVFGEGRLVQDSAAVEFPGNFIAARHVWPFWRVVHRIQSISRLTVNAMAVKQKVHDPKTDPEFQRVVKHFLTTPAKPHTPKRRKVAKAKR